MFVLNILAVLFYARVDFFTAMFAGTVAYSIQHLCERCWEYLRYNFSLPLLLDRLLLSLVLILALTLYGYLAVWNKKYKRFNQFDRLDSRLLLLIAVAVVGVSIVLDLVRYEFPIADSLGMLNLTNLYSAICSFLVLLVSMCHLRESDARIRADIADQLLHSEQARFEQDKAIHDAINIKCHDIRHQIDALGEKGYRKELREIGQLVNIYDTSIRSENTALDVVLSNKSLACLQKNITFSCIADGRHLSFLQDEDVYALFGNIMDNAIDAVSRIADPERRLISLSVRNRAGCLIIEEENFFEGEIRFDDGLPVTSKEDRAYHGFGMQSIRMLTERYEGDIQLESDGGIFKLSIMLPIPS
ncbi:MAG: sensor histidine kinase [Clostridia bacterium]|nr:sensor histidine kinase [Clostridia bacterium]